jgi:hypothetical protein
MPPPAVAAPLAPFGFAARPSTGCNTGASAVGATWASLARPVAALVPSLRWVKEAEAGTGDSVKNPVWRTPRLRKCLSGVVRHTAFKRNRNSMNT